MIEAAVERDKFMTPEEAKEFGIIDDIPISRPPSEDDERSAEETADKKIGEDGDTVN